MNKSDRNKTISINFEYRVTYENGKIYDRSHTLAAQITLDEYKKIIIGVLDGKQINEIEDISEALEKMSETVHYMDGWTNMDGSRRTKPLKKSRCILELEYFLTTSDYNRFKKMKNPIEVIERPEERMTIYRNDGSNVVINYEYGQVKVADSRTPTMYKICEADSFLSDIVR